MISSSIGPCDQLLDLLSYQSFDLSVGYRQIKSVPTMLVMLSYSWLIPRAYTITSLVWPMLSPCSLNYGIPFKRKPRWIVVEPIDNILISSMILLNIKLVLETFESIFFMLAHEVFVWWKEWLPLIHVHLVKVAAVNLRKIVLFPLESSQISHAHVRSILWSGDLQPSFHMCPEHTKPLIDLFKEKKFLHKS